MTPVDGVWLNFFARVHVSAIVLEFLLLVVVVGGLDFLAVVVVVVLDFVVVVVLVDLICLVVLLAVFVVFCVVFVIVVVFVVLIGLLEVVVGHLEVVVGYLEVVVGLLEVVVGFLEAVVEAVVFVAFPTSVVAAVGIHFVGCKVYLLSRKMPLVVLRLHLHLLVVCTYAAIYTCTCSKGPV